MCIILKKIESSEHGISLVEVLASIVILTIMISVVFMVFIQTAKTTRVTESTIDATYIAQTVMENIYQDSREQTLKKWKNDKLVDDNYQNPADSTFVTKQEAGNNVFYIQIHITKEKHIVVKVYQNGAKQPQAQMENFYIWRDETT